MGSLLRQRLAHGLTTSTSHHFRQNGYQERVYSEQSLLHRVLEGFKEEKWQLDGSFRRVVLSSKFLSLRLSLCSRGESGVGSEVSSHYCVVKKALIS